MAEQLTDALLDVAGTVDDALTANVTTAFDITWAEPDPPTSASFPITLKGTADDGSDDALFHVTAMTGSAVTDGDWIKVGNQTTFDAGTEIALTLSDASLRALIQEYTALKANASHTHAQSDVTGLTTDLAAKVSKAGDTMTGRLLMPNGSAAVPFIAPSSDPDIGMYRRGANQLGFSVNGTEAGYFTTIALNVAGNMLAQGGVYSGVTDSGSALAVSGTTPTNIEITAADAVLTLPQVSWNGTTTPVFRIADPLGLVSVANPLVIELWFSGVSFNSLNEADAALGIWDDQAGGYGPGSVDGKLYLTDTFGVWQLTRLRNDPGVSGATGGWQCVKISDGTY